MDHSVSDLKPHFIFQGVRETSRWPPTSWSRCWPIRPSCVINTNRNSGCGAGVYACKEKGSMQTETASKPRHSVFENCRDLIGADLYRRNAFRVLGMSIDASVQSATKSQKPGAMDQQRG